MALSPVPIPWPTSSAPGATPQESAGRLINVYAEPLQADSGPAKLVWRRGPGLTIFATSGQTGFRGGIRVNNLVFLAYANKLITVDASGTIVLVGTLSGTKPVTFARNNKTPTPDICCVTENGAFLVTSSSISSWPDPNLPQPNSVAFQDGYFFWTIGDRRTFASNINSTTVNALCFTTVQSRASDTMYRVIPYGGLIYFFCSSSCEIYQNAGASISAPAFPYSRANAFDRGLIGSDAISGWEDGFGELLWAADDGGVWHLTQSSNVPDKVSPPDLDRLISAADPTTLKAICYVHDGHRIWELSSPTWTWAFNINTKRWHEGASLVNGLLQRRRARGSIFAFNKWLTPSDVTGNVLYVDPTAQKEEGQPMLFRMESGPVQNFPNRTRVGRADFYFITGQGLPNGADNEINPRANISWSDDGLNWGIPIPRLTGVRADGQRHCFITGLGRTGRSGRRYRIDISDGVKTGFLGAVQGTGVRAP